MSGYTSGNNAPTLMAQAPNRKGNISKHTAGAGGVTTVTSGSGGLKQAPGNQGKPSVGGSVTAGRGQKVTVVTQCDYDAPLGTLAFSKTLLT